jgi:anti-sigma factor RsiW
VGRGQPTRFLPLPPPEAREVERVLAGAARRIERLAEGRAADGTEAEAAARVPRHGGMSLHADVSVPARDRRRLERLCRYVSRPPLANERLEERPHGTLALPPKTRWRDGSTHIAAAVDGGPVSLNVSGFGSILLI